MGRCPCGGDHAETVSWGSGMATPLNLLLALFLAVGALFIALSIPLILRRVPPNPWYGFRVRRTLASPEVWYPANAHSSWLMAGLGLLVMLVALAAYFVPGMAVGVYGGFVAAFLTVGLVVVITLSFAHLGNLPDPDSRRPDDS